MPLRLNDLSGILTFPDMLTLTEHFDAGLRIEPTTSPSSPSLLEWEKNKNSISIVFLDIAPGKGKHILAHSLYEQQSR